MYILHGQSTIAPQALHDGLLLADCTDMQCFFPSLSRLNLGAGLFGSSVTSELANVLGDGRVKSGLQLRSVAKHEQNLEPYKEWSQEKGLNQIVQQRRGTTFEDSVADKLGQP